LIKRVIKRGIMKRVRKKIKGCRRDKRRMIKMMKRI